MLNPRCFAALALAVVLLAGCSPPPNWDCPPSVPITLPAAGEYPGKAELPFQMPLANPGNYAGRFMTNFAAEGWPRAEAPAYHAAEDYADPPGTPVYAMAAGEVTFSGPMGGYGWLIIVDHPQANLYTLYGHLSPSRWRKDGGTVSKGELIAYLGDSHENGGSYEKPLVPHLHFGMRAGQRSGYPSGGEWRWQAGWIGLCPQDLGWLQPSVVIEAQQIPACGFRRPEVGLLTLWGFEAVLAAVYLLGAAVVAVLGLKRKASPYGVALYGVLLIVASWVTVVRGLGFGRITAPVGIAMLALGVYIALRRRRTA